MNKKSFSGFSLLELLIVLTVLGILLTMGVPAMSAYLKDNEITNKTNLLIASLNFARGEAITRNTDVHVSFLSAPSSSNEWGYGWEVWADGYEGCDPITRDNTKQDCEVIREFDLSNNLGVIVDGSDNLGALNISPSAVASGEANKTISFSGDNGRLAATGDIEFYICDASATKPRPGRHVQVSAITGRVAVEVDSGGNPVDVPGAQCP